MSVNKSVSSLSNVYFSPQKVCAKLSKLKASFSSTPDEIPGFLLQNLNNTVCIPISLLYQHFFRYNYFLPTWKTVLIVPIYKKSDPYKYDNYRLISLTSIPCKAIESFIQDEMIKYLSNNNLMHHSQHGFRKLHSIGTQLLEYLDNRTYSIDNHKCVEVCCIDFFHAFDSVSTHKLIHKLSYLALVASFSIGFLIFLNNRHIAVKLSSSLSLETDQISGIP